MQFGLVGVSYKNADLSIRDLVGFTDSKKIDFLKDAQSLGIGQAMILSTCNRSEVYFFYDNDEERNGVRKIYEDTFRDADLSGCLIEKQGSDALRYLFRVTSGMESQVLGEDQILGQVKDALDFSRTMGYSHKEMNKVVRDAVTCAKRIKTELKVSEIPLSVSYVGIRQLEAVCGIAGRRVFVIGSGKMATLAIQYAYEYGAAEVTVCNHVLSHTKELKKHFNNIIIVNYEDRYDAMAKNDIVISATSSPHLVLRHDLACSDHKTWLLDLAAPRDIDISFSDDPQYVLINLDSLQQIVTDNEKERIRLMKKGESLLEEDLGKTLKWLHTSRMDGTIQSLQQRCDEITKDSFNYLCRKIELNDREKTLLKKTIRASLERLIKEPICGLKQLETEEQQEHYKKMVNRLFNI